MGAVQDVLGGTVILFQENNFGIGVGFFKIKDVLDVGAAEAVYALVGVADDAKVAVFFGKEIGENVLGMVGVLVFVDGDVFEFFLIVVSYLRLGLEKLNGFHDDVVKVQGAVFEQCFLVEIVNLSHFFSEIVADKLAVAFRSDELVFGIGDVIEY